MRDLSAGFKTLFCDADNLDVLKILVNSFLPADRQVADREVAGFTVSEKRDKYIADMISERDYENILRTAQHIGQREGFAEGVAEGEARGQMQERLTIAKALLKNGANPDLIAASTGLSIEEVLNLAE